MGFPCTTAICISLLGGPYTYLLQKLLDVPSYVCAWMLVSRLDSESQPIVLLLPVDSISAGIFLTRAWKLENFFITQIYCKFSTFKLLSNGNILLEAPDDAAMSGFYSSETKNLVKHWQCPWGSTIVDAVAPEFKLILEENYLSSSNFPLEKTKESTKLWWTLRKKLDYRLGEFLR